MIRNWLAVLLFVTTGCGSAVAQQNTTTSANARNASPRESILRHTPTNSDKRCVGISVVSEALLDGIRLEGDGPGNVAQIAQQIYNSLPTGQEIRYRRDVTIEGVRVPIHSEAAIDKLSTLIADKYKRDYFRLLKTEEGRQKLLAAQNSFVVTSSELERILDADVDKIDAFCGFGRRLFPDGTLKKTTHAFLIGKRSDGDIVVYDPNDPGSPIICQILNKEGGVTIKWTCQYRDTGHITTQCYRVVHKDRFFRVIIGE